MRWSRPASRSSARSRGRGPDREQQGVLPRGRGGGRRADGPRRRLRGGRARAGVRAEPGGRRWRCRDQGRRPRGGQGRHGLRRPRRGRGGHRERPATRRVPASSSRSGSTAARRASSPSATAATRSLSRSRATTSASRDGDRGPEHRRHGRLQPAAGPRRRRDPRARSRRSIGRSSPSWPAAASRSVARSTPA